MIRYNMNDVTSWSEAACPCGTHQRSITKIYGRSDNMVKLRGVNVFPEAIGAIVSQEPQSNGEYVCVLERDIERREQLTVLVEDGRSKRGESRVGNASGGHGLKRRSASSSRFRPLSEAGSIALTGSVANIEDQATDRQSRQDSRLGARHQDIMKIFDCHSHWGTKRGYIFRTEAELAQQEKIWKTKVTFFTEDEQVAYFRQNNAQGHPRSLDHEVPADRGDPGASRLCVGLAARASRRHGRPLAAIRSAPQRSKSIREFDRVLGACKGFVGLCVNGQVTRRAGKRSALGPVLSALAGSRTVRS